MIELTVMDRRWQMVLDCQGAERPPFSQGTLQSFRERVIAHELDAVLFERTVALARESGGYSAARLRAAFDASPLWGAGRVEDTFNLIGRAALHVVRTAAERLGRPFAEVASEAGIPIVAATSIKAGLDIDWDDRDARQRGIAKLLEQVQALGQWLETELRSELQQPPLSEQWELVQALVEQDTEPDPGGGGGRRIKRGVAKDRRISVSDPDMRHGRKSKRKRIDGYKRHVAVDVDSPGVIYGVAVTPANAPERVASQELLAQLDAHGAQLGELLIDRGYLGDAYIEARRQAGVKVSCKPFPLHNAGRFDKRDFIMDLDARTVRCPGDVTVPLRIGKVLRFPRARCRDCAMRQRCTRARTAGRSLSIHPQEPFFLELRREAKTPEGREQLRRRTKVEHGLARIHNRQGDRARYRGLRKNLYDLRRHAALSNLSIVDRMRQAA